MNGISSERRRETWNRDAAKQPMRRKPDLDARVVVCCHQKQLRLGTGNVPLEVHHGDVIGAERVGRKHRHAAHAQRLLVEREHADCFRRHNVNTCQ